MKLTAAHFMNPDRVHGEQLCFRKGTVPPATPSSRSSTAGLNQCWYFSFLCFRNGLASCAILNNKTGGASGGEALWKRFICFQKGAPGRKRQCSSSSAQRGSGLQQGRTGLSTERRGPGEALGRLRERTENLDPQWGQQAANGITNPPFLQTCHMNHEYVLIMQSKFSVISSQFCF